MAKKAAAPNPFAAAKRAVPASQAPKGSIYIADAVLDQNQRELFPRAQVIQAHEAFMEGHRMATEAENMMSANRPILLAFGRARWCNEYIGLGKPPENPKIVRDATGAGGAINFIIQDRQINMNDDEKARLANIVGADRVDECVVNEEVFTLNAETLERTVKVNGTEDTVMNHLAAAIQDKFADHPQLVAELFTVKPVQRTAKGLIDRGVELVTKGDRSPAALQRLVSFIETGKFSTQLKPAGKS